MVITSLVLVTLSHIPDFCSFVESYNVESHYQPTCVSDSSDKLGSDEKASSLLFADWHRQDPGASPLAEASL